jgi:intein/homing endonuclease
MPNKRKELKIEGQNLWYLVGLITSDGCLCKDGRHIDITFKDQDFLQGIKESPGLVNRVCEKNKGTSKRAYRIQIANKNFYDFLLSIGLMKNKSLILGKLKIPDKYFIDFIRGLIDGDGCIRRWRHPSNQREQWSLRIYSGSERFITWLNNTAESLLKIKGKIYKQSDSQWVLKYGKMAARKIAEKCYYKNCLGLYRKIKLAQECFSSYIGWKQSRTVFN